MTRLEAGKLVKEFRIVNPTAVLPEYLSQAMQVKLIKE